MDSAIHPRLHNLASWSERNAALTPLGDDTVRILLAEDEPGTRRLLEANLAQWGYEVVACADGAQAWELLGRDDAPRLALFDWMMPALDGVELCRRIRQQAREHYTYVILLTAKSRLEDLVEGMDAGADDYVTKPFDPHELKVRLRAGRRILELQAQLLEATEALRFQATHDPLTGLWNRGATLDILRRELARAERQTRPLAVVMADLDCFKQVNDTQGHLAGDTVLREVAHRMTASVRAYDSVGRFGGEEFLLIFPDCDGAQAGEAAERIRARIGEQAIDTPSGPAHTTMSLGVATTAEVPGADGAALLKASDEALYRAKAAGRDRVERIAAAVCAE